LKALERIEEAWRAALRFGILVALGVGPACGGETKRAHPTSGEGAGMAGTEPANGSGGSDRGSAGNESGGTGGAGIGGMASGAGSGGSTVGNGGSVARGGSTVASGGSGTAGASAGSASGGFAGAPTEKTDSELCEASCTELNNQFEIPGALCEDWRPLDDKYVPVFCGQVEATGCSGRCTERLNRGPEACHDALRAGVPCVASDSFYKLGPSAEWCYLEQCYPQLFRITAECNGLREELADARARWDRTVGDADYSFWYESGSISVKIDVTAGVPTVVEGTLSSPLSIEDLFARVELEIDDGSAFRLVDYDETFGHPFHTESVGSPCHEVRSVSFDISELDVRPGP
jgi:hypothetical protein